MIPKHVLEHLELREGRVNRVYLDSLDNPTAGVGHLLTEQERLEYAVGDKVSDEVIDAWLEEDARTAWLAAYNQCNGIRCPELQETLFHINYQLGAGWPLKFPKTWRLLREERYIEAAVEICLDSHGSYPSNWLQQTPLRVSDAMKGFLDQEG